MEHNDLSELCKLPEYRAQRAHIFETQSSLDWFVRRQKTALVQAGALRLLNGQWHALPRVFDAVVLQVGATAASSKVGA